MNRVLENVLRHGANISPTPLGWGALPWSSRLPHAMPCSSLVAENAIWQRGSGKVCSATTCVRISTARLCPFASPSVLRRCATAQPLAPQPVSDLDNLPFLHCFGETCACKRIRRHFHFMSLRAACHGRTRPAGKPSPLPRKAPEGRRPDNTRACENMVN